MNPEAGEATTDIIKDNGGSALFVEADISDEQSVACAVQVARQSFGGLHIASNNAALSAGSALIADFTMDDFQKTYAVTLFGTFFCMKYQLPVMIESGGGAIVNIGSRAADSPNLMMSAYDSAKAAVNGLTRSAAKEYAPKHIRVNCINPGVVRTEGVAKYLAKNPKHESRFTSGIVMKRLARPEELAEAVVWLCSDRASYITGQSLNVDGGMLS